MCETNAGAPESWKPLTLPTEVREQLATEHPDLISLKRWVLKAYAEQSGIHLHPETATPTQYIELATWLGFHASHGDLSINDILLRRWRRLQFLLFINYNEKASTISQRYCQICCGRYSNGNSAALWKFVIRITPISRQAASANVFKAFQSAFKDRFKKTKFSPIGGEGICLALTFVLSNQRRDRDIDNMSKAMIDAFSRAIGFNDRLIHHLDALKLIFTCDEEYVFIGAAPSLLNRHDDIVVPVFHQSWAGMDLIDLSDHLPTND